MGLYGPNGWERFINQPGSKGTIHIALANMPDIGATPEFNSDIKASGAMSLISKDHNTYLRACHQSLENDTRYQTGDARVHFLLVDVASYMADVIAEGAGMGMETLCSSG